MELLSKQGVLVVLVDGVGEWWLYLSQGEITEEVT